MFAVIVASDQVMIREGVAQARTRNAVPRRGEMAEEYTESLLAMRHMRHYITWYRQRRAVIYGVTRGGVIGTRYMFYARARRYVTRVYARVDSVMITRDIRQCRANKYVSGYRARHAAHCYAARHVLRGDTRRALNSYAMREERGYTRQRVTREYEHLWHMAAQYEK